MVVKRKKERDCRNVDAFDKFIVLTLHLEISVSFPWALEKFNVRPKLDFTHFF